MSEPVKPEDRDPYSGLRIVGWGPFRLPGERRRMRKAQER